MPAFETVTVDAILLERPGLQRVETVRGSDRRRAFVLTQLTGPVSPGDRVVVNTTAVDLGLGTGGWDVVHWNLSRESWQERGPGHILKLRYTSLQVDTGAAEEHDPPGRGDLGGAPVVACALHSQLAPVAAVFKAAQPARRLVYVMTDGGALPIALSDQVHDLLDAGLLDATVTTGHAFGGNREAVTLHSGLLIAREAEGADAIVAGIGPGVVGTGSRYGHTGLDVVAIVDAAGALGGAPILAARHSEADPRERHRGRSHHTEVALELVARSVLVASPEEESVPDVGQLLARAGLHTTTMGRGPAEDGAFFEWAGAAGAAAARMLREVG